MVHEKDLETIGKHCNICNYKDFLPFTCSICKIILCKDCNNEHIKKCSPISRIIKLDKQQKIKKCANIIGEIKCKKPVAIQFFRTCEYCLRDFCQDCRSIYMHDCLPYKKFIDNNKIPLQKYTVK